ncbi:MAG: ComEC/Rec2 family competence protein, partial [Fusobacterium sp.]
MDSYINNSFSLGTVYFFTKKKSILIYIIPILFVIRLVFGVHSGDFDYLENIRLKVELNRGVGKVLKIDNKNLKNLTFVYMSELADGKYNVLGEFKELEKKEDIDIISINRLEVEKLEDSFLEKYFENRVEGFIEKGDRYFKRVYRAIILGESREIPKELREKFNYVGVSHLFALSGLHIGIIIGVISFISSKFSISRDKRYWVILI